jgi:XTP/dITP diphosphohydrolase
MKLLIATKNKGKINELKKALRGTGITPFSLLDYSGAPEFEEPGKSFPENACAKALFYHQRFKLPTMADDSGLSVTALHGEPGVHSARYGGKGITDEERNKLLLSALSDIPKDKRTASFHCALAFADHGEVIKLVEETCDGLILTHPRGRLGFGYDPIFYYPPLGKTFAELHSEVKNAVSHRGRAISRMTAFLRNYLRKKG